MMTIKAGTGCYYVVVVTRDGQRLYTVGKDKSCSCNDDHCPHIDAVRAYLMSGGKRAPEGPFVLERHTCPLCDDVVDHAGTYWRCRSDPAHFFMWLNDRHHGMVKAFLTQPHPNKAGPFYEMTIQERDRFLEEHEVKYEDIAVRDDGGADPPTSGPVHITGVHEGG